MQINKNKKRFFFFFKYDAYLGLGNNFFMFVINGPFRLRESEEE